MLRVRQPARGQPYVTVVDLARILVNSARRRAKRDGLPFDLTHEDITIPERCPALGIPLAPSTAGRQGGDDASPSLDRLVPELGYVPGNVRVISRRANSIKQNAAPDELLAVAAWMETEGLS